MRTILAVQILRAVAAGAVVITHAQHWLSWKTGLSDAMPVLHFLGAFAVCLFFVISGFIMVYTSEPMFGRPEGPKNFFLLRLVRIVPFYWIVTAAYIAGSLAFPQFGRSYGLDFIAASFLFIPMLNADGDVLPIVGHGWTLNYEMQFYALFALALLAPRRIAVASVTVALVAMVVAGQQLSPKSTVLAFWTSPVILQFVYGMLIGLAYREGLRVPKPLAVALVVGGCVLMFGMRAYSAEVPILVTTLAVILIMSGATFGDFALEGPVWRLFALIGDASYSIYLLHSAPIRAALAVSQRVSLDFASAPWLYVAGSLLGAIVLGMVAYYACERPVTRYLRRLLKPRKLAQASAV